VTTQFAVLEITVVWRTELFVEINQTQARCVVMKARVGSERPGFRNPEQFADSTKSIRCANYAIQTLIGELKGNIHSTDPGI
jgi:hypothetical protein